MKKCLPLVFCTIAALFALSMQAQIKGDPVFNKPPQPVTTSKSGSNLSAELQKLYNSSNGRQGKPSPNKPLVANNALDKYVQVKDGRVVVDITVKNNMAATKAALQQMGFLMTGVYGRVISGTLPIDALPKLDGLSAVQFARPAFKPMHQAKRDAPLQEHYNRNVYGADKILPVISQGDTAQRSNLARKKYRVSGKGVKVGILSDSYNNLGTAARGILMGELPGPGNPFHYSKPVEVLEDLADSSGTDEGRGMAEIIHDVAPEAALAFHTAFLGEANFAQGIQDLVNKGCKVITDDIAYFDEPFFQDGIIAQSVDQARQKGITYISAAGNYFDKSYESDFRASAVEALGPGNGTAHDFSAPGTTPRYYQPIYIPSGGSFLASFQWDQPFFSAGGAGTVSDLDIYLIDIYGNIVAAGITDNIKSGDPIEFFGYDNNTVNYTFFLLILKHSGPDPTHVKYNMYFDAQFYLTNPAIPGLLAPTLVGHAKADGAIATAAAFYKETPAYGVDTPLVERFSSLGGVVNYFDVKGNRIRPLLRKKPEITAPDGGNTSFFDPFANGDIADDADHYPNFFGTSAAAPHAAGVAALMIEAEKLRNLTPGQIKGILSSNTVDMDNIYTPGFDKGFDFNTGFGLIKADGAVGAVKFPSLYIKDLILKSICSTDPVNTRAWKITNPNPFEVEVRWFILGSNQDGRLTAPPGDSYLSTKTVNFGYFQILNLMVLDWDDNFGFTRLAIKNSLRIPCGSSSGRVMEEAGAEEQPLEKTMLAEVYPNPATNVFRIYLSLADQQPIELQLFSIDGKQLLQKRITQTRGVVPIDAAAYRPGVYLLQIRQGAFNKTIKLIKQ